MGRANRDVGGYRGRRTITDILRFIAIALAVIVALVLAGLFYLQKYLVYTDEGVRLDLPPLLQMFRREEKGPAGSGSLPDVSVVIDPAGSQPEPQPGEEKPAGFALQLTVDDVTGGSAAAKLEQAGAEALVLEMKAPSGQLGWRSQLFTADWAEVNAPESNNEALKQWNGGDVYTIARVCCFRDDSVPYSMNNLALRRGNYNWRDELGLRWLSPAHGEAQAYIAGLCGELGALGFDEIVLEQFYFPAGGNTDSINRGDRYDPASFTAGLEDLLTQVRGAVEPYGTKVSLRIAGEALGEGSAVSGVTPELLERFGDRIWGDLGGLAALPGLERERTVRIVSQAGEDSAVFQAVIPEE